MKNSMTIIPIRSEESKKQDEIKQAAEILLKAREIEADDDLMEQVNLELEKKKKHIRSIQDLRDAKNSPKDENEEGGDDPLDENDNDVLDYSEKDGRKIMEKTKDGDVLEPIDETGYTIEGPTNKTIYTKPKKGERKPSP